ncbi:MAG: 2-hydroxy-3-oxopropionate reductase [Deltaproteobacteria bacterium]|nr:2-hydroxy-3-oxopropionate reductase [Deltaproteobacteria bacterium]
MQTIGFIGLGIMGKPMSKNLIKAGYPLVVHDKNREPVREAAAAGAQEASSSREVAEKSQVVITMLPNSPDVREAALGKDGIVEGARPGLIYIDMSSIAPQAAQEVASGLAEKGARMLDAPVSGGEPGAVAGTLAIMVGGDEKLFEEVRPILQVMGKSVERVGDIGAGNTTKLANQIMVAVNIAGLSEALVLGSKAGVDPERIFEAVRGGLAGSNCLNAKAPLIMERKFDPGFRIRLHIKDLANALETGRNIGVPLPLTSLVMEFMQALRVAGDEEKDHGALVRFFERLAAIEVKKSN